jgi:hypothetical protein
MDSARISHSVLNSLVNRLNEAGANVQVPPLRCYSLETYAEEYNSILDKAGPDITQKLGIKYINLDKHRELGIDTQKVNSGLPNPPPPNCTPSEQGEYNRLFSKWVREVDHQTFFNEYPDNRLDKFSSSVRSEVIALKNIVSDVRKEVENGLLTHEDIIGDVLTKFDERLDKVQEKFEEQQEKFEEQQAKFEERQAKFEERQAKFEERLGNVADFVGGMSNVEFFRKYLNYAGFDYVGAQKAVSSNNNRFKVIYN